MQFDAHRNVLAASSDYLRALFRSDMRDADDDVILQDVPGPVFAAVLDFIYDGKCEIDVAALPAMLEWRRRHNTHCSATLLAAVRAHA